MSDPFVRHRLRPIVLAITANLKRLSQDREARTIAGVTGSACVIGGGPSCKDFDRIGEGVATLTVNTAAPKVCAEFSPDVLVIREVVGVADQLAKLKHKPKLIVLDIGTAPSTVAAAYDTAPVAWAIPAQTHLAWLIRLMDVRPFYSGESAMTMAVSLTEACEAVSLLGCDLAFGKDGTMYGEGTAWPGIKAQALDHGFVDMGNRGGMQEHGRSSGAAVPLLREQVTPVMMEDGSEGLALATWVSQRLWVEQWAKRHPATLFCNMSGGAKIEGAWPEPGQWEPYDGENEGHVTTSPLDTTKIDQAVRLSIANAKEALEHEAPWTLGGAMSGWPLVELAAQPAIVETLGRKLPLDLALADRLPIMRSALEAVEEAWSR